MPPPLITHLSQYAAENTVSTVLVVQHSCAVFSAPHVIYFVFSFKLLLVIKAPLMFFCARFKNDILQFGCLLVLGRKVQNPLPLSEIVISFC